MNKIDIVLPWVDGNDPEWQKERNQFFDQNEGNEIRRFRDWDNFQYVLRGIDKFMPWVNKVYFVTWGHLPSWLNKDCSKLVIVNHRDFIPVEYLPTFNSNTIDLNVFRIKGLSEQYVLFNDDTFVVKPTRAEDFFVNGLPCDMACLSPIPVFNDTITHTELNNLIILNSYFSTQDVKKKKKKWIRPILYGSYTFRTLVFMRFSTIIGVFVPHIPISHLKSTMKHLWEIEYEAYDSTCKTHFRHSTNINDWLAREWQIMSGEFIPRSYKFGHLFGIDEIDSIKYSLRSSKNRIICINDNLTDDTKFEMYKELIKTVLDGVLPDKSIFEL